VRTVSFGHIRAVVKQTAKGLPAFLLLAIPLLAGCVHSKAPRFDPAAFTSPGIERSLEYWTATYSLHGTNHFYVCATELDRGALVRALVYWREEGRILDYLEEPRGAEAAAWRLRPMVDRDAVMSDEKISISNHLVSHRVWVDWMKQCITSGREYVVTLKEAKVVFPRPKEAE
jgi:hypothetical protein